MGWRRRRLTCQENFLVSAAKLAGTSPKPETFMTSVAGSRFSSFERSAEISGRRELMMAPGSGRDRDRGWFGSCRRWLLRVAPRIPAFAEGGGDFEDLVVIAEDHVAGERLVRRGSVSLFRAGR